MRIVALPPAIVAAVILVSNPFYSKLSLAQTCPMPRFLAVRTYEVNPSPYSVTMGDFNGDNKLDLVVGAFGSNMVYVLLNNGDGTLQNAVPYSTGTNPVSMAVADFNADGRTDLVVAELGSYDAARGRYTNSSVSVHTGK